MKKTFSLIAFAIALISVFVACKKGDDGVDVTSVTLDKKSKTLFVAGTLTLEAAVLPENATNKTVTWKSDNDGIATVVNGTVTAVAKGTTTITATTENGNKTATCTITVFSSTWNAGTYGIASFATDSTYIVGSQEWSDAVQTTICSGKTDFAGKNMGTGAYLADCRSNSGRKGDLFSWEMVNSLGTVLCPEGWRVPTKGDFETLNTDLGGAALIGTDVNPDDVSEFINANYLNSEKWAGDLGGFMPYPGPPNPVNPGVYAWYWSATSADATTSYVLKLVYNPSSTSGIFIDNSGTLKEYGSSLRCVRDL